MNMVSVSVGTSRPLIFTCHSAMAAGDILDVLGKMARSYFIVPTLWILQLPLEYRISRHFLKPRRATHSTNKIQGKGEKQIVIGPRVKGRYWKAQQITKIIRRLLSTLVIFQSKRGLAHLQWVG
jgi:hypothetical protein